MARRRPSYDIHGPTEQQMMDMDIESLTRRTLMQDPLVKKREKEIRAEIKKGVNQAKKSIKRKK
jgi:hypothetical protein